MRTTLVLALLAVVVLTAACGASTATPAAAVDSPPTLVQACGDARGLHGRTFWAETRDRVRLYMAEAGTGKTTVVLAHGGGSDLCETLDFARELVHAGYRTIAFDFRGDGNSGESGKHPLALGKDLAAAVAQARKAGAVHVFLIGSSMGGAAIVQNTSTLHVTGRISLSGTRLWPGYGINGYAALPRIRDPFLYVGSRDDWRAPVSEARGIFRRVGATDKRMVLYPGSDHGWGIFDGTHGPRAKALVLGWIARHS